MDPIIIIGIIIDKEAVRIPKTTWPSRIPRLVTSGTGHDVSTAFLPIADREIFQSGTTNGWKPTITNTGACPRHTLVFYPAIYPALAMHDAVPTPTVARVGPGRSRCFLFNLMLLQCQPFGIRNHSTWQMQHAIDATGRIAVSQ